MTRIRELGETVIKRFVGCDEWNDDNGDEGKDEGKLGGNGELKMVMMVILVMENGDEGGNEGKFRVI